jgi:hypothetical protein
VYECRKLLFLIILEAAAGAQHTFLHLAVRAVLASSVQVEVAAAAVETACQTLALVVKAEMVSAW